MIKEIVPKEISAINEVDGKHYFMVTDSDDHQYSCWHTQLRGELVVGTPVKAEIKEKTGQAKYDQIKSIIKDGESPAKTSPEVLQRATGGTDDIKYRSMCFSYIKDLRMAQITAGIAKTIDLPELMIASELVYRWCVGEYKVDELSVAEAALKANKVEKPKEAKT